MACCAALRRVGAALTAACLALVLAGCNDSTPAPAPGPPPGPTAAQTRVREQHLLDQRVHAVRTGDRKLFLRALDHTDPALMARQRRLFANLVQLPLERFDYQVLAGSWPTRLAVRRGAARVRVPKVRLTLQLRGYDARPQRELTGFAFATRGRRLLIVSDRPRHRAFFPGFDPSPWDVAAVHVEHTPDVLGRFDSATRSDAGAVLAAVSSGIGDVTDAVPFTWSGHVVVYDFADAAVLASYHDVPGGNINHLGAMTFPVHTTPDSPALAGLRFTVLPSSVRAGQPFLGRIVRHELTHVALGAHDDGIPTWLAEGLAEYVGARPIPSAQRRIASVAVNRSRGGVTAMPSSADFNGADQEWHYALSWMACDYIAATQGEARLWSLMSALHADGRGTSDTQQDAVLTRVLGFDSHELARRAAARIQRLYG
jgi:hypothetical protein